MPTPKGEFEVHYGGPWTGIDYSRPYTNIAQNSLAPGSVNTAQHNGFLCSSPWIASSPYTTVFAADEFVLGISPNFIATNSQVIRVVIVVTNKMVYQSFLAGGTQTGVTFVPTAMSVIHVWGGAEINAGFFGNGHCCSFVEINGTMFIGGLMLQGIFSWNASTSTFAQATTYVAGRYLRELGGRLIAAQCRFPTGGGTGTVILPTVVWSAVGVFTAFDPAINPQAGFNLLSDVPDEITGIACIGRSALLTRTEGFSQMDPNAGSANSGLQPFVFYHLWASLDGIGAFPGSVAQYGETVFFRADDGIYSISIGGGLKNLGAKIISKVAADFDALGGLPCSDNNGGIESGAWYFASVVHIAGQLHYLLAISAATVNPSVDFSTLTFTALVYDYNVSEDSWNLWDLSKYSTIDGTAPTVRGFSTPIVQTDDTGQVVLVNGAPQQVGFLFIRNIMFGNFTGYGTLTSWMPGGTLQQFVPFGYDFNNNPVTAYLAALYAPLEVPRTTIVFRGEVISSGHKNTERKLRIQADNAPVPTIQVGAQQQLQVSVAGPTTDPSTNLGTSVSAPLVPMAGNAAPVGLPIKTYYGDFVAADEMIQATITTPILDSANPWKSLAMFRIANVDIIGVDTKGTQA